MDSERVPPPLRRIDASSPVGRGHERTGYAVLVALAALLVPAAYVALTVVETVVGPSLGLSAPPLPVFRWLAIPIGAAGAVHLGRTLAFLQRREERRAAALLERRLAHGECPRPHRPARPRRDQTVLDCVSGVIAFVFTAVVVAGLGDVFTSGAPGLGGAAVLLIALCAGTG